ncbi:aldo/keto reductase family protein [Rhizoctonia solani]|uniref:Aldo/keto reductase family protein n=1 Tax=Rhizoctonia solani TaxID=456999 RepID=A0A8H8NPA2_9AGAM|nr:aldo/keto reductase family protein [Rhizoctonia solani]QRW15996.1 aldo/keto reductase family protein [Rhizoctonia solani]
MRKLTDPQPTYDVPSHIPETMRTIPEGNWCIGHEQWPSIIFGAGTLGAGIYNSEEVLDSPEPLRTVRLALRYGIRAFDTSAYYGTSEIVLGSILKAVADEFLVNRTRSRLNADDTVLFRRLRLLPNTIRKSVREVLKGSVQAI